MRATLSIAAAMVLAHLAVGVTPVPAQEPDGLVFRRIWSSAPGTMLPDMVTPGAGRYLPGTRWANGGIGVLDLERNETVDVTGDTPYPGGDFAMGAVISPDGRRIAYQWRHFVGMGVTEFQLRVVNRDGTDQKVILSGKDDRWLQPMAWTPDGRAVLVSMWQTGTASGGPVELQVVSLSGGAPRVLERFDSGTLGRLFVSPDGRYAAYDFVPHGSTEADIYAIEIAGGEPRALVRGNGNDIVMGWMPDGSGILFYSNRELTHAIWKLAVTGMRPVGNPRLVRADVWNLIPMGFSGGRYFYQVVRASAQVRTATLDVEGGRVINPPSPIREPSEGWSRTPFWSPDGRYLGFLDYPIGVPAGPAHPRLGIRAVHSGEMRYLPFPFQGNPDVYWLPDNRTLLVFGGYRGTLGVHRFDLQSGAVTTVLEREPGAGEGGRTPSPDGSRYYYHRDRSAVYVRDLRTGQETQLARIDGLWRRVAVSADDRTLVVRTGGCWQESRLLVLPTTGGEPREIYRGRDLGCSDFLALTPDTRHVVAAVFDTLPGVWRFPLDGGKPVKILGGEAPRGFRLSPDGRRIAYWDWPDQEGSNEIWVIDGLTAGGSR